MTDDATTHAEDDASAPARGGPGDSVPPDAAGQAGRSTADVPPGSGGQPSAAARRPLDPAARRRRWLVGGGIAGAAVLVLLVCGCLGAAAAGLGRFAREADLERTAQSRAESACRDLEKRLNRLNPPGAAANPGQRAAAIRDENAAVQPFLSEIERLRGWWSEDEDDDDRRDGRGESWRELVDARSSYADALDRQVTNGDPAFFIAPQDHAGRPVLDRLERGPDSCGAAARRLAAPDL
ncbi:hypothetical protein [Plantactinospora soyae]|uniref:Uncharacterized protein n=1 Tax=Plantactinospora soyae TaxID=1544732 RepID=A0A927R513_9ACTN|nr:hypothetical protein [Plantactinospora soyae]MBE1487064.1 hypothetical protein [Plantactinospora soyae]